MFPKLVFMVLLTLTLKEGDDEKAVPYERTRLLTSPMSEDIGTCNQNKAREIERYKQVWKDISNFTNPERVLVDVSAICVGVSTSEPFPKGD